MKLSKQLSLPQSPLSRVSLVEKAMFTKHLSVMLESSISITDALITLKDQATSGTFKRVIGTVLKDIVDGQPLSKSLAKHPRVFNTLYVRLIKAGEESGTLSENMSYLSSQLTKDYELRQKVRSAMIYPSFVLTAVVLLGGFVSYFILPELLQFFRSFKIELPLATRVLMNIATIVTNYTLELILATVSVVFVFIVFIKLPQTRPYWHALLLRLPVVGKLNRNVHLARMSRNLGVLLKSGIPISNALILTAGTLSNIHYKNALLKVQKSVKEGNSISKSVQSLPKSNKVLFPPLVWRMIEIGEKTGTLEKQLLYVADFFDDAVSNQTKNLASTLEPVLLLVIGAIVGFVAIAVISPIYELTGSIRR